MWNPDTFKNAASMYSSTAHLFVYQPCDDDDDSAEAYDCGYGGRPAAGGRMASGTGAGYADSLRSESGTGSESTPEPIYDSTANFLGKHKPKLQNDSLRLSGKYGGNYSDDDADVVDGVPSTASSMSSKQQRNNSQLTELELLRMETFFGGQQTRVFVCKSLANLYLRMTKSLVGLNRFSSQPDVCVHTLQKQENRVSNWQLKYTGVPVIVLHCTGGKARNQRRIQFILAERDTGFTLWSDIIDNLSNYEAAYPTFHTMRLSTDHRQIAGLSFDCPVSAQQLFAYVETLTSDPINISLSAPKCSRTTSFFRFFTGRSASASNTTNSAVAGARNSLTLEQPKRKLTKKVPTRKSDISQPCFFQHVTSVDINDRGRFVSLQTLLAKK